MVTTKFMSFQIEILLDVPCFKYLVILRLLAIFQIHVFSGWGNELIKNFNTHFVIKQKVLSTYIELGNDIVIAVNEAPPRKLTF